MQTVKFCASSQWTQNNLIRLLTATGTVRVQNYSNGNLKSWKDIPGPNTYPIVGAMHHFLPGGIFHNCNGLALAKKMFESYGPIVRLEHVIGRDPRIYIYDAESAAQILRSENDMPLRPGLESLEYYRRNVTKDAKEGIPKGLTTDNGHEWKELRSTVNPVMLQPKTIKLYTTVLDEVAKDMVKRIKSRRDESKRLIAKFEHEISLWSFESIAVVALGCRMGCLDPNLPDESPAKKLLECLHEEFILFDKLDFRPSLWKIFPTPNFKRAMALCEHHETISKQFIKQAMHSFKQTISSEKSILEKLLEINEDLAHVMASDLLFAGVDGSANTLAATLYLLAVNPEKQNKLREALKSNDDKRYLKACLKESMRMMPISLGTRRVTSKEYNILGYKIPANMNVTIGHQLMSLMEEHYPCPMEYIPERWLAKDGPLFYKNAHSFAFAPFGFGVRNCIGRRIAELMLELSVSRMVEQFQIDWIGPAPIVDVAFINYVKGPFNFIFKDAINNHNELA